MCKQVLYGYLKEKRNIKKKKSSKTKQITIVWVKIFIEMMFQTWFVWKVKWKHKKTLAQVLKTSVCLKSNLALN